MRRWLALGALMIVWGLSLQTVQAGSETASKAKPISADDREFFEKRIRPLLVENCFKCHSGPKVKGKFWLDNRAALLKGGESGLAVVPGNV